MIYCANCEHSKIAIRPPQHKNLFCECRKERWKREKGNEGFFKYTKMYGVKRESCPDYVSMGDFLERYIDTLTPDGIVETEINNARADAGLGPIKGGKIKCLKCDRWINSKDLKNDKLCPDCRTNNKLTVAVAEAKNPLN